MSLDMTLSDFHKKYYPNLSQRALGKVMGITDKQFTQIKKQQVATSSKEFKKAAEWIKYMHNVNLTYKNAEWVAEQKYSEIIRQKDKKIMELEDQIQKLQLELAFREDFSRCKKYIINQYKREEAEKKRIRRN